MAYVMVPASKVIRMCERTVEIALRRRKEAERAKRERHWLLRSWPVKAFVTLAGADVDPEPWTVGLDEEWTAKGLMRAAKLAQEGPDQMVRLEIEDLGCLADAE